MTAAVIPPGCHPNMSFFDTSHAAPVGFIVATLRASPFLLTGDRLGLLYFFLGIWTPLFDRAVTKWMKGLFGTCCFCCHPREISCGFSKIETYFSVSFSYHAAYDFMCSGCGAPPRRTNWLPRIPSLKIVLPPRSNGFWS